MTAEEYDRAMQGWVDAQAHSGPEQKRSTRNTPGSMQRERGVWPRPIGVGRHVCMADSGAPVGIIAVITEVGAAMQSSACR